MGEIFVCVILGMMKNLFQLINSNLSVLLMLGIKIL